jgi:hypothetical protein
MSHNRIRGGVSARPDNGGRYPGPATHAIEQLEAGSRGHDGSLLVASHDADPLDAIGIDRTIALPMNGV